MNTTTQSIIDKQFQSYCKNPIGSDTLLDKQDIILSYNKNISHIKIKTLSELEYGPKYRLQLLFPYIQKYIEQHKPKSFDLIIALGDTINYQYSIPSICFSRSKKINSILIPNIDLFSRVLYRSLNNVIKKDISFVLKNNQAIFIGSSTGTMVDNKRIKFCRLSQKTPNIKGYIHNLCQAEKSQWISEYPDIKEYLHLPISIADQLKHKIVINIDGNTVCWSRLYWQMQSNSLPLYIDKTQTDIQFFDYVNSFQTYEYCSLDNSIDKIHTMLEYPIEKVMDINNAGKDYISKCFDDYLLNPTEYLQNIINTVFDNIIS